MPVDADLPKLHRGPMNLWVEDALTSEYLNGAWGEPRILFLIAGSSDSVRPVVKHACLNGAKNVFGLIDRDFEATNEPRWANPELRHFILPVHEMENYLLDANALAGCDVHNRGRSVAEIETRMLGVAGSLLYWMAANSVIKRMRQTCLDDFMARPKQGELHSEAEIWTYIETTPWYQHFPAKVLDINTPATIQGWINEAVTQFTADLGNDAWKRSFSGKEILRDVRGFIYDPPPSPVVSSATHDVDLAQSIARWHITNNCVPADLSILLGHIRTKAGV